MLQQLIAAIDDYNAQTPEKKRIITVRDCPLAGLCTFQIGGPADLVAYPCDLDAFIFLVKSAVSLKVPYLILGKGSNVLPSDDGYRGMVINTTRLSKIETKGNRIYGECGASLLSVTREALGAGLSGLEFAYGIPGSVGGAVYMNAGAYEGQMSDVVDTVRYLDTATGEVVTVGRDGCRFGYRTSLFTDDVTKIILSAKFALRPGNYDEIKSRMDDLMRRRVEKQPLDYPSAGSIFKRCSGHFTARLIEEAGLKGLTVGGAQISPKHAGFIINTGGATSADVETLIEIVKERIYRDKGLSIECEVRKI